MRRVTDHAWMRALLAAALLPVLALCSGGDPELEAALERAEQELGASDWDAAIATTGEILLDRPEEARARVKLGRALLGKARIEEKVVDEGRMARARMSSDPEAFFDPDLFRTELSYDPDLVTQARAELEAALETDDSILEAHLGITGLYAAAGLVDKEREHIARAAAQFAGDEEALAALRAFGQDHFQAGRNAMALAIFDILSVSFESDPGLALSLGAALFATGRYDDGVAALEEASREYPEDVDLLNARGQVYLVRLEWKKAADVFEQLVSLLPDDAFAPVHQGAALMPIDAERAAQVLMEVIGPNPDPSDQAAAVASNLHLVVTAPEVETDDLVRLAAQLNQFRFPQLGAAVSGLILERDPESVPGRIVLAFIYDNMRYFDLALTELNEASQILTGPAGESAGLTLEDLYPHYGRVYYRMGDYAHAVEALTASPDPGRYAFTLAICHEHLEDFSRAYKLFRRVIDRGSPEQEVVQARAHLEKEVYANLRGDP